MTMKKLTDKDGRPVWVNMDKVISIRANYAPGGLTTLVMDVVTERIPTTVGSTEMLLHQIQVKETGYEIV